MNETNLDNGTHGNELAQLRADLAATQARECALRAALTTIVSAVDMRTYGTAPNADVHHTYDPSFGGGECSKYGRYYGVCHSCRQDEQDAQERANWQARWNRDRALAQASEVARATLAAPSSCPHERAVAEIRRELDHQCAEYRTLSDHAEEMEQRAAELAAALDAIQHHDLRCEWSHVLPPSISQDTLSEFTQIGAYYIGRRAIWEEILQRVRQSAPSALLAAHDEALTAPLKARIAELEKKLEQE